jgi:hypothetical protein
VLLTCIVFAATTVWVAASGFYCLLLLLPLLLLLLLLPLLLWTAYVFPTPLQLLLAVCVAGLPSRLGHGNRTETHLKTHNRKSRSRIAKRPHAAETAAAVEQIGTCSRRLGSCRFSCIVSVWPKQRIKQLFRLLDNRFL